ncbi:hypothetical protein N7532_002115 [Penicillium argentinense]|uniref:Pheromone receptor n=1 Tax=Penicillium argentinense TaxID=1131581 RepID=A0A9W9G3Q5_9EURO|nr:uncharacterized protein N7532_002115 [Penicillium argentinense]KAJ5111580.1 hypothetical protein N7532_002115 [Penicillium argentinense]
MDNFDPYQQNITIRRADGLPLVVPLVELDSFVQYNVRICINYGSQLGASLVLFVILLLLTRQEKRGSAVFTLNSLALLFNIIRLFFGVLHFDTGFEKIYPYFTYDYSAVETGAYVVSIFTTVFSTLLVVCIEISLVLQTQVVCATLRRRCRVVLLGLSILVALVPIGFRFGWMIMNCIYILNIDYMDSIWWLESATSNVITTSICFFCAIFVTKLGYAIRQRNRLGVRDFGPMKVIFVCGCQTMTIPAIFSILQYRVTVPELQTNVLTLVTISLPLSSLWATAALEQRGPGSASSPRRNLWKALAFGVDSTIKGSLPSRNMSTSMTPSSAAETLCYAAHPASKRSEESEAPFGIAVEHDICINSIRREHSVV